MTPGRIRTDGPMIKSVRNLLKLIYISFYLFSCQLIEPLYN